MSPLVVGGSVSSSKHKVYSILDNKGLILGMGKKTIISTLSFPTPAAPNEKHRQGNLQHFRKSGTETS